MDVFSIYLLLALVVSMGFGFFAQLGQFCPVGGLRETLSAQGTHRLWAYFTAIAVALIGVSIIEYMEVINLDDTKTPYRSDQFAYGRNILGGFMFGLGMVLASGCGMRNLIRVGQGSYKAVILVVIMALSAYAMTKTSLYVDVFLPVVEPFTIDLSRFGHQDLGSILAQGTDSVDLLRLMISLVIAAAIVFFALHNPGLRQPRYLLSAIAIGLAVVAGYVITGAGIGQLVAEEAEFMENPPLGLGLQSYSFAAPMADAVYSVMNPVGLSVITFGVVAVIGLPLGALMSSLLRQEFKVEGFRGLKDFMVSGLGALLVGVGAVLAMGCSIGHGLTGIATLAIGSFTALAAIAVGAYVGLRIEPSLK